MKVLDADYYRRLLGLPADTGPGDIVKTARAYKWNFAATVLSSLRSTGISLGEVSTAELARHEERAETYREIAELARRAGPVRVSKGPAIAKFYPEGVQRHIGDLDLVFEEESAIFQTARSILDRYGSARVDVTFFGWPRQLLIALRWSAEDEFLDTDFAIDLMTTPFAGDADEGVGVRAMRGMNDVLLHLLSLGEESFQREFGPSDALDWLMLAPHLALDSASLEVIKDYCLAPEILKLITYASGLLDLPMDTDLSALSSIALEEQTSRRNRARPVGENMPSESAFEAHLLAGGQWNGMEIDVSRSTVGGPGIELLDVEDQLLLRCQAGDHLLVRGASVTQSAFDAAIKISAGRQ